MSFFTVPKITEFYQRNESKLILIVVIILSIYLLAFAAKITWSLIPEPVSQSGQQARLSQQSSNANSVSASNNINKIISQNLFGNASEKRTVAKVEEVNDVPETKLNLILSGVVSSNDPNRGAAIIEYRDNQSTYGVGDKIEGTNVTLDEIYVDRVIIKNRVTRETLMLDGIDFDEANKKRANDNSNSASNRGQAEVNSPKNNLAQNQNKRNQAIALRQARQKLAQEPASFTDMISLAPHRVDGVFIGFRVTPGAKPTLFNSVGLKNGDVVVQLNGLDLTDLQQSKEAMTQLQEADSLQLEVLRSGQYVSLELDIPEASGNE
ncbi:MAG: general secretion pathway protein C [Alphaproteobacteria bacterium]|jgi:general secretion pathway protein C